MRTSPNCVLLTGALSVATFATALTAQSTTTSPTIGRDPIRQNRSVDPETGNPVAASLRFDQLRALPQDGEYSVVGMYERLHGEFLRNSEGFRPDLSATFGIQRDGEFEDENGQFDFNEYRGELLTRAPVDPDTHLIIGGNVGLRAYRLESATGVGDEDLWEVSGEFGLGHFLSEDLLIEATFRPGVYSDFDGSLKSDDWQFFGRALATWQPDPEQNLYLKVGLDVSEVFEDAPVYPLVGISWMFLDNWRLDALLPLETAFRYTPSAEWIFSAGLNLDGDLYHRRVAGAIGPNGNRATRVREVRTQELRLFVDATYRASDELSVFGRFGSTLAGNNSFELWRAGVGGSGVRDDYDGAIDSTLFFEVGVGLNF